LFIMGNIYRKVTIFSATKENRQIERKRFRGLRKFRLSFVEHSALCSDKSHPVKLCLTTQAVLYKLYTHKYTGSKLKVYYVLTRECMRVD